MKKERIVVFTKTNWSEAPRIRHQVTNLLISMGYEVIFFEKPTLFCWMKIRKKNDITFVNHFELIQHRLRYLKLFVNINKFITEYFIKKAFKNIGLIKPTIINFNYDYFFIRKFTDKNIITIINDDFVNKLNNSLIKKQTENQLRKTCEMSNINMAVSYPLVDQLKKYTNKVNLFLPWSENKYKSPNLNQKRDVALFFGYINYRIDWELIYDLANAGTKIRFIGPVEGSANQKIINEIKILPNIEFTGAMRIDEINFSDICCSILPWDTSIEGVKAITINNKCFNLLSYGIPQIFTDLPYILEADNNVISKCSSSLSFQTRIKYFSESFEKCQIPIKKFLNKHYSETRQNQLKNYL